MARQDSLGFNASDFSRLPYLAKCNFLESLIHVCGFSELSFISRKLDEILRIDFLLEMPEEVQELVIGYLDFNTLWNCRLVCRSWNQVLLQSPMAYLVLLRDIGASPLLCQKLRDPLLLKKIAGEIHEGHLSLYQSSGIRIRSLEGHSDSVSALHYKNGMLASASHDGTARVANLLNRISFERLFECPPSASIELTAEGLLSAQFDGNLRFQPFDPTNDTVLFRGHSGVVHCFDLCLSEDLLVSGGEDWKLITWKFAEGQLIKIFSSHSAPVVELKLEQITESHRPYARNGDIVLYSKDRNTCQVSFFDVPYNKMTVVKTLRSIDGHVFKHGLIVNQKYLVLNTRLRIHIWCKYSFHLARTVSCEHFSIPDLLGWGTVFGLLVDYFGLYVVAVATGAVVYKIPVSNLRRQDRTYTRFIAGDVPWLDGFTGNDSSQLLYASAMSNSYNVEVTSWIPHQLNAVAAMEDDS